MNRFIAPTWAPPDAHRPRLSTGGTDSPSSLDVLSRGVAIAAGAIRREHSCLLYAMSRDDGAEDGPADADHRGTFLNGNFKIVTHAHREVR